MAQKPKHGDVVHMKGTVSDPAIPASVDDIFRVRIGDALHWVPVSEIVHVEPAPLKVGDSVIWLGDITVSFKTKATILAIDTGINQPLAWIRQREGAPAGCIVGRIVRLDELERADEPRPLKVGDKVQHKSGWFGTIVELSDVMPDGARVRRGNITINDVPKSDLERVE